MDSREAFLRVDVDYVYAAAKWGKAAGVRRFVLVSAPGANEGSPIFYLRAKGRIERRVSELGFDSLQIVRPPIILGERSDARPLERLAAAVFNCCPPACSVNLDRLAVRVSPAASVIFSAKSYKNSLIFFYLFCLISSRLRPLLPMLSIPSVSIITSIAAGSLPNTRASVFVISAMICFFCSFVGSGAATFIFTNGIFSP